MPEAKLEESLGKREINPKQTLKVPEANPIRTLNIPQQSLNVS